MPKLSHREGKGEALQESVAGEWRSRPAEARLARPGTRPVGGQAPGKEAAPGFSDCLKGWK